MAYACSPYRVKGHLPTASIYPRNLENKDSDAE